MSSPTSPRRSLEEAVQAPWVVAIFEVLERAPELSIEELQRQLSPPIARRTLQRRLAELVESGWISRTGQRRGVRYGLHGALGPGPATGHPGQPIAEPSIPISPAGAGIRGQVRRPIQARVPVSYNADFLERYVPNETSYLSEKERAQLSAMGRPPGLQGQAQGHSAAGTFANDILDRLLIDLSFASSRLEGNTYSLLDTQHLIERGEAAQGKDALETQMILNHKDAIEFLVRDPSCARVGAGVVKSLHAFLSDGLLPDPADVGRLRNRAVGISGSVYVPLALGLHIEEQFELLVNKAAAIRDPFEQALFLMVQLPYLQPFMDVNKRVSRLAANIPLVQANLCPLSFIDVPTGAYTDAMLGVYELNRVELLRDVLLFAYERSCQKYAAVKQSLQPPDTFRTRFRRALSQAVAAIVRSDEDLGPKSVERHMPDGVPKKDRARFVELVLTEFKSLNPESAVRFGLRPLEFEGWQRKHGGR